MKQQIKQTAREVLGQFLHNRMKELGYTIYKVKTEAGLHHNQLEAIFKGNANYTIDSLLAVLHVLDMYVFFAEKDGKHLDPEHMVKKREEKDPHQ